VPMSGCGQPPAVPAAPRIPSWRSFGFHIPGVLEAGPGVGGRGCSGRCPPGARVPGVSVPDLGVRNFTQQLSGRFGAVVVGCGLWRLSVRGHGAGGRRRAGGQEVRLNRGRTPGARGNSCRPRPAGPTVTRSIKLIRARVAPLTALGGPKTPAIQGFRWLFCAYSAGLRWGLGGCNVFQVAARETAKSW
jgi:hypothetical protein